MCPMHVVSVALSPIGYCITMPIFWDSSMNCVEAPAFIFVGIIISVLNLHFGLYVVVPDCLSLYEALYHPMWRVLCNRL